MQPLPDLRIAPVESGSNWVRYLLGELAHAYEMSPHEFDEDPVEVFRRNIYIHPFHEEDPIGLVEILGADRVLFGSDYPHPEGMSDPITFVDELKGLDDSAVRKVMGGNLAGLMHVTDSGVTALTGDRVVGTFVRCKKSWYRRSPEQCRPNWGLGRIDRPRPRRSRRS